MNPVYSVVCYDILGNVMREDNFFGPNAFERAKTAREDLLHEWFKFFGSQPETVNILRWFQPEVVA